MNRNDPRCLFCDSPEDAATFVLVDATENGQPVQVQAHAACRDRSAQGQARHAALVALDAEKAAALKVAANVTKCGRCAGKGTVAPSLHRGLMNGVCFQCGGRRTVLKPRVRKEFEARRLAIVAA